MSNDGLFEPAALDLAADALAALKPDELEARRDKILAIVRNAAEWLRAADRLMSARSAHNAAADQITRERCQRELEKARVDADHDWALWYEKWRAQVDTTASYAVKLMQAESERDRAREDLKRVEAERDKALDDALYSPQSWHARSRERSERIIARQAHTPVAGPKKPEYEPRTAEAALAYLVEECGEVLAAVGKAQRFGLDNYNPDVPPDERETNAEWLWREMNDLEAAIRRVRSM